MRREGGALVRVRMMRTKGSSTSGATMSGKIPLETTSGAMSRKVSCSKIVFTSVSLQR